MPQLVLLTCDAVMLAPGKLQLDADVLAGSCDDPLRPELEATVVIVRLWRSPDTDVEPWRSTDSSPPPVPAPPAPPTLRRRLGDTRTVRQITATLNASTATNGTAE